MRDAREARRAAGLRRGARQRRARLSFRRQREGRGRLRKAAAHVTRLQIVNKRIVVNAMEPRAAVAAYDRRDEGRFTLYAPTQGVMGSRANAAEMMNGARRDKVRFVAANVGGSFGMKGAIFPEYVCAMHAARDARPAGEVDRHALRSSSCPTITAARRSSTASWRSTRTAISSRVALHGYGDSAPTSRDRAAVLDVQHRQARHGVYRTPLIEVRTRCVFTNTVPITAYRGAGRPEGNYYMERLIDTAAARDGHRSGRDAPPQPHPARPDALQGAVRLGLRQRRFSRHPRQGARGRRLERLCRAQGRQRAARACCAAAASASSSR